MRDHPQLTLSLDTAPATSFDSFHVDEQNALTRDAVRAFVYGELDDVQMYLWGSSGTGKSHLLSAACDTYNRQGYRIAYLPGEMINHSESIVGMENLDLLCIDDLQRLDHAAEVDLFNLINRCRALGTQLIIAADRSLDDLGLALSDLKTRLAWGLVFQIKPLSEDGLRIAFRKEIELRSLEVSDEVLGYVFKRFPRRMSILKQVVDELDEVSLMEQRRITVPFIKSVFGEAERAALAGRIR
ncbi:MAG: DnaA regulatory inactivator Hda [Granulosicoccus sp.]